MSRFRLTIAAAMGVVLLVGIGLGALIAPSLLFAQAAATLALTALLVAALGAILDRDRACWLGFALFGGAYALLSLAPGYGSDEVRPWLLTTRLLDEIFMLRASGPVSWPELRASDGPASLLRGTVSYTRFQVIGHSLSCLLHGLAGGALARVFVARRAAGRPVA